MAPGSTAWCCTVMRAFFVLGVMMVLLGADVASHKQQGKNRVQTRSPRNSASQKNNVETAKLFLDPYLLSEPSPVSDLGNRSLSPWTYSYTYDEDLFPDYIAQAQCLGMFCLDSDGKENTDVVSKPIYHQMLVLRRVMGKQKKQLNLRLETKMVTVGCTCVRPIVLSQK